MLLKAWLVCNLIIVWLLYYDWIVVFFFLYDQHHVTAHRKSHFKRVKNMIFQPEKQIKNTQSDIYSSPQNSWHVFKNRKFLRRKIKAWKRALYCRIFGSIFGFIWLPYHFITQKFTFYSNHIVWHFIFCPKVVWWWY